MDDPIAQYFNSPTVGPQGASVIQVETTKLVPLLTLIAVLCGLALAMAFFAKEAVEQARFDMNAKITASDYAANQAIQEVRRDAKVQIEDARRAAIAQMALSERETRMLEYYLLELDAKVISAGLKDPKDGIAKKIENWRKGNK